MVLRVEGGKLLICRSSRCSSDYLLLLVGVGVVGVFLDMLVKMVAICLTFLGLSLNFLGDLSEDSESVERLWTFFLG